MSKITIKITDGEHETEFSRTIGEGIYDHIEAIRDFLIASSFHPDVVKGAFKEYGE